MDDPNTVSETEVGQHAIIFEQRPSVVEVEVDRDWYAHDSEVEPIVCGQWHAYKGHRWHAYQLTSHWKRISDGRSLELAPGRHTVRIRIVPPSGKDRGHLITSLPLEFRVLGDPVKSD